MALDRTTEAIAHFVGVFQMAAEELRMRDAYDLFAAQKAAEAEVEALDLGTARFKHGYKLEGYDPGVAYLPPPPPVLIAADAFPGLMPWVDRPEIIDFRDIPAFEAEPDPLAAPTFTIIPWVPIPSSLAVFSTQTLTLHDADILGLPGFDVITATVLEAELVEFVAEVAETIDVVDLSPARATPLDPAVVDEIAKSLEAVEPPTQEGLSTALFRGAEAKGTIVNGQRYDDDEEWPSIETLYPEYVAQKRGYDEEEDTDETDADAPDIAATDGTLEDGETSSAEPFDGIDGIEGDALAEADAPEENPWAVDDGHLVIAGANDLQNETVLVTSMIDAGVIAVAGDSTSITAVSQVNALRDHDSGTPEGMHSASTLLNRIDIVEYSDALDDAETEDDDAPSPDLPTGLPESWNLEIIEGDVITLNMIEQYSYALDTDVVDFTIHAGATYIGLGDNVLYNGTALFENGFGYDLILVGGDKIDITLLSQTNILLDDDTFHDVPTGTVESGDNALINTARLETHGIDAMAEMELAFAEAMENLSNGMETLSDAVAQHDLFEGIGALRALYITGDLKKITSVSQTNILGDQDQVSLALDAALEEIGDDVEVLTGGNAMTNSARLIDFGFDSVVMTGGDVYDDALIYQAGLIDTNAAPQGVGLTPLAKEAVAFLADDLLLPGNDDVTGALGGGLPIAESGPPADIMQTVLA